MKIIKNLGLMTLALSLLISTALIIYPEMKKSIGVIITSVDANNPCKDIMTVGSTITGIGNKIIRNSNDFNNAIAGLEGVTTFTINNNPRSCNIPSGSQLNMSVANTKTSGMKLGTDLWGGVDYVFETNNESQVSVDILKQRSVKYGLSDTKIDSNNTFIKITTSSNEESYINLLTEQGRLEGRIEELFDLSENPVEFVFNDKSYEISLKDKKYVKINESSYEVGDIFNLDGVDVSIENTAENKTTISIKIFDSKDLTVMQDPKTGYSRILKQGNGYVFAVPVILSPKASEDFVKTTKNLEVSVNPTTGESYSSYPISVFIDGKKFLSIPILSDEMGKKISNLVLWSYSSGVDDATKNMIRLKTIIELKDLPQDLVFIKRDEFKSNSGLTLTTSLLTVSLVASAGIVILFFVKFRRTGVASLPLILMVLSEFILLFSIVSANWFILVIFFAGCVVIFSRGDVHNWKGWMGVLLFSVLLVGIFMSKSSGGWVLDSSFLVGSVVSILIGFAFNVFVGAKFLTKKESYTQSDYRNSTDKLWLLSTVLVFVLIISYFILSFTGSTYTGLITAISVGLWINLSLVIPVYSDVIKKYVK